MFLWQMTDQKCVEEKTVIQYFMCAYIYKDQVSWRGQCLKDGVAPADGLSYDIKSNKRFAYVIKQFYPTSNREMINPDPKLVLSKRYLHWEKIMLPYPRDILNAKFPPNKKDEKKYNCTYYFGMKDGKKQVMYYDGNQDELDKIVCDYSLFHYTLCFPEQSNSSAKKGYIFMKQDTGYLNLSIHCNPAGGIGISMDLTASFIL
jgi:hypothetical protein